MIKTVVDTTIKSIQLTMEIGMLTVLLLASNEEGTNATTDYSKYNYNDI